MIETKRYEKNVWFIVSVEQMELSSPYYLSQKLDATAHRRHRMTCFFREPYLNILFFIRLPLETKDKVEKDKQQDLGKTAPSNHDRVRGNHGTVYAIGRCKNRRHTRNSFLRQSALLVLLFFCLADSMQSRLSLSVVYIEISLFFLMEMMN